MNYQGILKKAFRITVNHRFLWLLGLFAGGTLPNIQLGRFGSELRPDNLDQWQNWQQNLPKYFPSQLVQASDNGFGRILGESINSSQILNKTETWLILGLVLIISLAAVYAATTARSAIVFAALALEGGKETSFWQAWRKGHHFFWRQLSLAVLAFLITASLLFVVCTPIIVFIILNLPLVALVLGIILLPVLIICLIYLALILPLAQRILVAENRKPFTSFVFGLKFFNRNWKKFLVFYLILLALSLGYFLLSSGIFLMVGLLGVGSAILVSLLNPILAIAYGLVALIIILIAFIAFSGLFRAFTSVSLTLAYLENKKLAP